MNKYCNFGPFRGYNWPSLEQLQPFFITTVGNEWFFDSGNDSAGFRLEGIDGTEELLFNEKRIDVELKLWGDPDLGVLLIWHKYGEPAYSSLGDASRLQQWTRTLHNDPMPVGLYIPFPKAWLAVKHFIETEGGRTSEIDWICNKDLPADAFPQR